MKRFYKEAGVIEREGAQGHAEWAVALDGRPVKTPAGGTLALPVRAAAELLAEEWAAQGKDLRPDTMPLTRLVNVALDRTPETRDGIADQIAKYGETDVVCHLAGDPEALRARQDAEWTPLRDWARDALGVGLEAVCGVLAARQPEASLARLRDHALALDDLRLTMLAHAVASLGSAVLGFALARGRLSADEAHAAADLDARFQAGLWGEDEEARIRSEAALAELRAVERLFQALP